MTHLLRMFLGCTLDRYFRNTSGRINFKRYFTW